MPNHAEKEMEQDIFNDLRPTYSPKRFRMMIHTPEPLSDLQTVSTLFKDMIVLLGAGSNFESITDQQSPQGF